MRLRWIPVLLWMGLIFFLSHQDGNTSTLQSGIVLDFLRSIGIQFTPDTLPIFTGVIRKGAHFTEYAILYFLLTKIPLKPLACFTILLLFSLSDEWHQTFVPGRSGQLSDVGIDLLGGIFVMLVLCINNQFKSKNN